MPNAALVKQYEQRFGPQIRLIQRMELHFMRLVADPSRQEFEKVAAESDPAVKAGIHTLCEELASGRGIQADPHAPIAEAIAKSVTANLPPEKAARYQKEIDLRAAARKQTIELNLVAMMDRILILDAKQREKLADVLAKNWDESWNQTQILMYGGQYFPAMPEDPINAVLTEAQRKIWRGISKGNVHFGINFGLNQGMEIEDEVWDDDPPKKKPEPATEKSKPKNPPKTNPGEKP